jgi:hypothetical protein
LEGNYEHFDENLEENKLIYTEIYQVIQPLIIIYL